MLASRSIGALVALLVITMALVPIVGSVASTDGVEGIMRAISVNPNRGDAGETIELEIFGENFEDGARISFTPSNNVIFVNSVEFVNSTLLKATIQIGRGSQVFRADLSVTNPNRFNSSTIMDAFTVYEVRRNLIRETLPPSASLKPSDPSVASLLFLWRGPIIVTGVIGIVVVVWLSRRHR